MATAPIITQYAHGHVPISVKVSSGNKNRSSQLFSDSNKSRHGRPGDHPVLRVLEDCYKSNRLDISRFKQIHALMLRLHLFPSHPYSSTMLLTAVSLSPFRDLSYALRLFDQIPEPNLYAWNILIRAHASPPHPQPHLSLILFSRLLLTTPTSLTTSPSPSPSELPPSSLPPVSELLSMPWSPSPLSIPPTSSFSIPSSTSMPPAPTLTSPSVSSAVSPTKTSFLGTLSSQLSHRQVDVTKRWSCFGR